MNWLEKYWPDDDQADRLSVASSRALASFCLLAGGGGMIITVLNLGALSAFPVEVSAGGIAAVLCLLAPLAINGSHQFHLRARGFGAFIMLLLAFLSVSNGALYSAPNLLIIPAVMTFTLALGARDGAAALGVACAAYVYCGFFGGEATNGVAGTEFAAFLIAVVFLWVGASVFRSEISRSLQVIQAEKVKSDQANAAKSEFLANMSHEIRTPLNGVLGMATVLDASALNASQKRAVDVIKSSGSHLLAMLNDILDLSKIEADELELEDIEFELLEVIERVRDLHEATAQAGGLELELSISKGLDLSADRMGDPTRLAQVLHNLISNAIKFTSKGKVEVVVEPTNDTDRLAIEVRDTGCGMTPAQIGKVFQPFVQADSSTTRRFGGTGLGLAICRRIVAAMGGELSVSSQIDKGSIFRLELALPLAARRLERVADAPTVASGGAPLRILVVDDSETNRLVAAGLLRPIQAKVTLAESGEKAVQLYQPGQFNLVFMDIRMPVMDGFETLTEIRRLEEAASAQPTPVVAMTANVSASQRDQYLNAGFAGFVSKPIDQADLIEVAQRTCR